jgi:uncharacterized membrane protein YphA (DoxX/SURF4 family)
MPVLHRLRQTEDNKLAGALRFVLGFIFFMAGILKVTVPSLGEAFSGQLIAADIPLYALSLFTVPVAEMALGITLLFGLHTRLSATIAAVIMIVAAYVHVAANDPALFPLQPVEPVGPIMLLLMLVYLLWKGGGAWSMDLRAAD